LQTQVREDLLDHWPFQDREDDLQLNLQPTAMRGSAWP
jgi:hypothetical protein